MRLDFIVTGTGRCGTLFAANFLTSAGTPCSHEAIFTPLGLDFAMDVISGKEKAISSKVSKGDNLSDYEMDIFAESSYMSAPFLHLFGNSKVIHMVRNPLKVVQSFMRYGYFKEPFPSPPEEEIGPYEDFIYRNIPELNFDMPQLDRACLYWIQWNELIDATGRVECRHRLEDSTEGLSKFIGSNGTYSKVSNASCEPGPKWSPSQIDDPSIRRRLKDLSKKYGYVKL
jgi:hypothetical protein